MRAVWRIESRSLGHLALLSVIRYFAPITGACKGLAGEIRHQLALCRAGRN